MPIVHSFNWDVPGTPTDVRTLPFSEVFDLDRLSNDIQLPVVEWDEIKNASSTEVEELGCWNVWEAVQYRDRNPRWPFNNTWAKQGLGMDATPLAVLELIDSRHLMDDRSVIREDHTRLRTRSMGSYLGSRGADIQCEHS